MGGKVEDGELIWEEKGIKEEIRTCWKDDKMPDSNGFMPLLVFAREFIFISWGFPESTAAAAPTK